MKWTEGEIVRLKELCNEGIANKDIAVFFGCPVTEIYNKRSQLGITIDKCKGKPAQPNPEFEAELSMPKKQEQVTKVLAQVKYRDLADLIFILSDQARFYHDLDECDELTLEQFAEWLCTMAGSVQLLVHQSERR